jgi:hypothetical protein
VHGRQNLKTQLDKIRTIQCGENRPAYGGVLAIMSGKQTQAKQNGGSHFGLDFIPLK